jgi:hypothetical protein
MMQAEFDSAFSLLCLHYFYIIVLLTAKPYKLGYVLPYHGLFVTALS